MTRRLLQGFLLGLASTAAVLAPLLLHARPAAGAQSGTPSGAGNPHGAIEIPCGSCHTAEGWTPLREELDFDHAATNFPLERAHRNAECLDCHESLQFSHVATACADCHSDPHRGELGFDCASCHSTAGWENRNQIFDLHSTTLFPLTGFHARLDCAACHREEPPFEFALTPTECFACHAADYAATTDPNHAAAGFPTDCEECHGPDGWEEARFGGDFDHSAFFPLTSGHAGLDCAECHLNGRFAGTPTDCFACHRDDYDATTDPDHANAGFPTDCEECHTTARWDDADFDHNLFFRLTGAHRTADCAECHVNGQYAGTPTDCYACHRTDFDATEDPDHADLGFPTDCEECHDTRSWDSAQFDHDTFFALTGAHRRADCSECHVDGRYAGTPTDCYACHREDYNGATVPDHRKAGFVTDCEECHDTKSWATGEFDHDAFFPITGRHRRLACSDCHTSGTYAGTPSNCYACHREDYRATTDPNHQSAGFPTDCEECHTTSGWGGAAFDHNVFFRLTGAHRTADCAECHVNGQYAGTPTDCVGCHRADYDGTDEPDHQDAGFPTTCEECHVTTNWDAEFDHNVFFQLTGAHRQADCAECHINGRYAGTPTTCVGCHQADYDGTDEPDHQNAGFPTTCEECHVTTSWDAEFDHNVFFQLTGAHRQLDCAECHVNGQYAGTPTNCIGCHRTDYNGTTDPDHQAAGFPTTCQQCHTTNNWDAEFDHNVFFQLTGAHRQLDCAECHVNGQYAGTPTNCIGCHRTDYNGTTDPDHQDAGFPTTCDQCHSTNNWDADFNHDVFFQLTGAHRQADCTECHVNGQYAGTPTNCIGCHRTDYNGTTDPDHQDAGFPTTCDQCHSTNNWDADFNHDVFFQLTGAHRQADCTECHVNGQYAGTPTNCIGCHLTDYNGTNDPDHQDAGFPTTCEQCHSTNNWDAEFDHDVFFQLTGAHRQADCTECHVNGQYAGTPTNCYGCHQTDYNGTSDPDHQSAGFPTDCEACHGTSSWEGAVFDHAQFFPITSGNHRGLECSECHVYPNNFAAFECIDCHEHNKSSTDNDHDEVRNYAYNSMACLTCHPDGRGDD